MYRQDAQNNLRYVQNQDSISLQSCFYYIPILKNWRNTIVMSKTIKKYIYLFIVFHIKKTKYKKNIDL